MPSDFSAKSSKRPGASAPSAPRANSSGPTSTANAPRTEQLSLCILTCPPSRSSSPFLSTASLPRPFAELRTTVALTECLFEPVLVRAPTCRHPLAVINISLASMNAFSRTLY
ncbi:uncharacterized protein K441DRAFT_3702 [Cenococcum geophilum 1.58]|uniref:uncharacterized protein n=1 Tax=Cenococcum geophilum 1.58 TaxID=794803 RepID=UPI00358F38FC|nr:hypothetical protein K441DRAFT_3702 [Cenococcum geophilum 1.58]